MKFHLKKKMTKSMIALSFVAISQLSIGDNTAFNIDANLQNRMKAANTPITVPNQYIVVLNDNAVNLKSQTYLKSNFSEKQAKVEAVKQMSIDIASRSAGSIGHIYTSALNGFVLNSSAKSEIAELKKDKRIAHISPDSIISINSSQSQLNPPWNLDRIDQDFRPLDNFYSSQFDGTGVNAYVIDSGVRISHSEFGNRAHSFYDAVRDGNGTNDCNGHGTHVAGILGGSTYGVAKNVNIHAVRVLGCDGTGLRSDVIDGINEVIDEHIKPAVANLSLEGPANVDVDMAINAAIANGITVVVAAGNQGSNACNYSPARVPNAITVGSTSNIDFWSDWRSPFSNFGSCLDLFAPGSDITSAWSTSDLSINTISGTSMAAPHVAGVVALYLDNAPATTPAQVSGRIRNSATFRTVVDEKFGTPNLFLNSNFGALPAQVIGNLSHSVQWSYKSQYGRVMPEMVINYSLNVINASLPVNPFSWKINPASHPQVLSVDRTHAPNGSHTGLIRMVIDDSTGTLNLGFGLEANLNDGRRVIGGANISTDIAASRPIGPGLG